MHQSRYLGRSRQAAVWSQSRRRHEEDDDERATLMLMMMRASVVSIHPLPFFVIQSFSFLFQSQKCNFNCLMFRGPTHL